MDTLPTELAQYIIIKLNFKDYINLCLCSKTFSYNLNVNNIWKYFVIKDFGGTNSNLQDIQSYKLVYFERIITRTTNEILQLRINNLDKTIEDKNSEKILLLLQNYVKFYSIKDLHKIIIELCEKYENVNNLQRVCYFLIIRKSLTKFLIMSKNADLIFNTLTPDVTNMDKDGHKLSRNVIMEAGCGAIWQIIFLPEYEQIIYELTNKFIEDLEMSKNLNPETKSFYIKFLNFTTSYFAMLRISNK